MNWTGLTIRDRATGEVGVVLDPVNGLADFYKVRFWREEQKIYVEKTLSRKWFLLVVNPGMDEPKPNESQASDPAFCSAWAEAVMELALATRDREWFDSVKQIGQRQK